MKQQNKGENIEDKTIFAVTEEDAQMGVERLTDNQIERIRKYVDAGLDSWSDVLEAAIRGVVSAWNTQLDGMAKHVVSGVEAESEEEAIKAALQMADNSYHSTENFIAVVEAEPEDVG